LYFCTRFKDIPYNSPDNFIIYFMQYDMKKLERMTLDELKETAKSMGIKVRNTKNAQLLIYEILDAQADQKAEMVQAKEDAKVQAKGERKRERVRVQQVPKAQKVSTDNLKAEKVVATVGNEKEQVAQMKEQLRDIIKSYKLATYSIKPGSKTIMSIIAQTYNYTKIS